MSEIHDDQDCWLCGARGWVEDAEIDGQYWCKDCAKIAHANGRGWPLLAEALAAENSDEEDSDDDLPELEDDE
jgi:hypothetical protein